MRLRLSVRAPTTLQMPVMETAPLPPTPLCESAEEAEAKALRWCPIAGGPRIVGFGGSRKCCALS